MMNVMLSFGLSQNLWGKSILFVNYRSLRRIINMECLPKFDIDSNHICEICVKAKLSKTPFLSIVRSTEPLELIYSDICDFKSIQTRCGKKYFITFIDDYTRYSYVYLIRTNDEALETFILYKNEVENQLGKKL